MYISDKSKTGYTDSYQHIPAVLPVTGASLNVISRECDDVNTPQPLNQS